MAHSFWPLSKVSFLLIPASICHCTVPRVFKCESIKFTNFFIRSFHYHSIENRYGAFENYCDPNGTLWHSGFGAWSVIFYVSKFWEFVDTWILVLKGKKPSFLQVYHHTGIAFCMWVGVLSQSSWMVSLVLLNSVIHTLMYTYFLIKTISPTTQIKSAKYLTKAQIGQFFTGIFYSAGVLLKGEECETQSGRFGLTCMQVYGYGLIALFMAFSKRKYQKKD